MRGRVIAKVGNIEGKVFDDRFAGRGWDPKSCQLANPKFNLNPNVNLNREGGTKERVELINNASR